MALKKIPKKAIDGIISTGTFLAAMLIVFLIVIADTVIGRGIRTRRDKE